ncbi:MAG: bifunctional hydroxymethylpyrimidine kinase/phosphomethylpyrimidine kinase [Planctomycetota bacterium]
MSDPDQQLPSVLFVGGSDPTHGAGLDADRDAAHAFECDGRYVTSAETDQDLFEVRSVDERLLWHRDAADRLAERPAAAIKLGLLSGVASIVEAARLVARSRNARPAVPAVVDPVISSSSGYRFWSDRELTAARDSLLVAGPVLTPNLDELAELAWADREALDASDDERVRAAQALIEGGASAVVAKGGHGPEGEPVRDLVLEPGAAPVWIERERVPGPGIRGSGCRFAAALACALARGQSLADATDAAGRFVAARIRGDE